MDGCDRCARGGAYITTGTEAQKAVRCQLWARVVGSSPACSIFYENLKQLLHIIGLRANQLSQSARPYIDVPEHVTNVWDIARMELDQRRLPFIIRRPMPDGTHEYWRLADLLIL